MFIDTHAHLFLPSFKDDIDAVIERARDAGIEKIFLPNIDAETLAPMFALIRRYSDMCHPMVGLHPGAVNEDYPKALDAIEKALHTHREEIVAVGEVGLDFYWTRDNEALQREVLDIQAQWALAHGLPIVLHTRESFAATLDIIRPYAARGLRGVFHCFTGGVEEARQALDIGFYLGIGGVATFKNSWLIDVIRRIGLGGVVLETDAPYLSPHPYRGQRNESARVRVIADFLAAQLHIPLAEVARITTQNARTLFLPLK